MKYIVMVHVAGFDTVSGIPAGSSGTLAELVFTVNDGYTILDLNSLADDINGFSAIDGSLMTCIPESAWLNRSLPETCQAGILFDLNYTYNGGAASVIETAETLPAAWIVLDPPWDELFENTYIWHQALSSEDAQLAFFVALGMYEPPFWEECEANCNGVDDVTAGDAAQNFQAVLGIGFGEDPTI